MRARAIAAVAVATAVAMLVGALGASAQEKPAGRDRHATVYQHFIVHGTNGFTVEVGLSNRRNLTVSANSGRLFANRFATYTLRAQQAPGSEEIKASLGKLGLIDMRFAVESEYQEEVPSSPCKGQMGTIKEGHWVGRFVFRGDAGYTQVRATRVPGTVGIVPPPSCPHSHPDQPRQRGRADALLDGPLRRAAGPKSGDVHQAELKVVAAHGRVIFEASRASFPGRHGKRVALMDFVALAHRDRGRIKEESGALDLLVEGPHFKIADIAHPTAEAVVAPPAPFLGRAIFRREAPHRFSWTGDLRLNLPGFGLVPLAGHVTKAVMCADAGCKH